MGARNQGPDDHPLLGPSSWLAGPWPTSQCSPHGTSESFAESLLCTLHSCISAIIVQSAIVAESQMWLCRVGADDVLERIATQTSLVSQSPPAPYQVGVVSCLSPQRKT